VSAARRLRVDWPACKANGVCADVVPALVRRDEWGYPLISVKPVPDSVAKLAERAVSACPTQALRLVEIAQPAASRRERRLMEEDD
jgi:ferredoxin